MIIFNHNLIFQDEPELADDTFKSSVEMILIVEDSALSLCESFSRQSDWNDMSGRKGRYHSTLPFDQADQDFSWGLEIEEVVSLLWDAKAGTICYRKGEAYSPERLRFWVFHTFFPLVLELSRCCHILHVGAVEIKEKPVLFSAFSYGGKSTLTDYFIRQGHTLLSDDSLAIEKHGDSYIVNSSYPFHRPYRELETLGYYVSNFSTTPKPLHTIFVLEKADPEAEIVISELSGIEKFKAFHYSSFIDWSFLRKDHFHFFSEMVKHISIYKIMVPWDMERLPEVHKKIVEHV